MVKELVYILKQQQQQQQSFNVGQRLKSAWSKTQFLWHLFTFATSLSLSIRSIKRENYTSASETMNFFLSDMLKRSKSINFFADVGLKKKKILICAMSVMVKINYFSCPAKNTRNNRFTWLKTCKRRNNKMMMHCRANDDASRFIVMGLLLKKHRHNELKRF